jgi:phenylalanine-4-hydroxylase
MSQYIAKQANAQGIIDFSDTENKTWQTLIERQDKVVQGRACQAFMDGLATLNLPRDRVPQCSDINEVLQDTTGWSVVPVAAMIPDTDFYTLLANKKFPAASFVRTPEDLDYLSEPDLFHEFYGHCPLLTHQAYADFIEWYGKFALSAKPEEITIAARLFWFTVEFGLVKSKTGFEVCGGGILSSKQETISSVEDPNANRQPLDFLTAMRTPYNHFEVQSLYYYLDSLDDLYTIQDTDLKPLIYKAIELGDIERPNLVIKEHVC